MMHQIDLIEWLSEPYVNMVQRYALLVQLEILLNPLDILRIENYNQFTFAMHIIF